MRDQSAQRLIRTLVLVELEPTVPPQFGLHPIAFAVVRNQRKMIMGREELIECDGIYSWMKASERRSELRIFHYVEEIACMISLKMANVVGVWVCSDHDLCISNEIGITFGTGRIVMGMRPTDGLEDRSKASPIAAWRRPPGSRLHR